MPPVEPTPEAVEAAARVIEEEFAQRALDCWPDFEREARAVLAFLGEHPEYMPGLKVQRRVRCLGCDATGSPVLAPILSHVLHPEGIPVDVVHERRIFGPWQEVPDGD